MDQLNRNTPNTLTSLSSRLREVRNRVNGLEDFRKVVQDTVSKKYPHVEWVTIEDYKVSKLQWSLVVREYGRDTKDHLVTEGTVVFALSTTEDRLEVSLEVNDESFASQLITPTDEYNPLLQHVYDMLRHYLGNFIKWQDDVVLLLEGDCYDPFVLHREEFNKTTEYINNVRRNIEEGRDRFDREFGSPWFF